MAACIIYHGKALDIWNLDGTFFSGLVAFDLNETQNLSRSLDVIPASSVLHVAFGICITSQATVFITQLFNSYC